ncbi:hypothetical protein GPALN_014787 [Globodera pallida]|nr:hypothetical protein GPALN_014787 [Globodera pallida]
MEKNVDTVSNSSFPELFIKNALRFELKKHTKIERLLQRVDLELQKDGTDSGGARQLLFHAIGDGCERCISCVEVLKKRLASRGQQIFQWNALSTCESSQEHLENEQRQASLSILISRDPFPSDALHSLSQQHSGQHSPSFAAASDGQQTNNQQRKAKKFVGSGATMKRAKTGNNKWKRPAKRAATK